MRDLDYASVQNESARPRRRAVPGWLPITSLAPIPLFVVICFTSHTWSRWLGVGQRWERITGMIWIATALFSLICIVGLAMSRKRWDVWLCIVLHLLFVAFTILPPGCIGLAWLMHWLTGPGA